MDLQFTTLAAGRPRFWNARRRRVPPLHLSASSVDLLTELTGALRTMVVTDHDGVTIPTGMEVIQAGTPNGSSCRREPQGRADQIVINLHYPGITPELVLEALRRFSATGRPVLSVRRATPHPMVLWKRYSDGKRFAGFGTLQSNHWEMGSTHFTYRGRSEARHRQNYPEVLQAIPALYVGSARGWWGIQKTVWAGDFIPVLLHPPAHLDLTIEIERYCLEYVAATQCERAAPAITSWQATGHPSGPPRPVPLRAPPSLEPVKERDGIRP